MSILARYASRLPAIGEEFRCTLGEGATPLVESRMIGPALGLKRLYFKCEHQNPTGSYKDRYIAVEMSLLRQRGATLVMGTSSGNTGSSLAAFAARYGLPCHLFVCERTPAGKLLQMRAHGARVYRVKDFCVTAEATAKCMRRLEAVARQLDTKPVISAFTFSPDGMRGVESMSYEILESLKPAHVFVPGGGCGLYVAVARGFLAGAKPCPRVHIVQPQLNDTVVTPLRTGCERARPVSTTTRISGLAVQQVYDGHDAIAVARATQGTGFLIDDGDAWHWQRELLSKEGIWVEPAGAVSMAGLSVAVREGVLGPDEPVVCILTGHGFKDPASAAMAFDGEEPTIAVEEIAAKMGV